VLIRALTAGATGYHAVTTAPYRCGKTAGDAQGHATDLSGGQ
jgi:hypothetical protein